MHAESEPLPSIDGYAVESRIGSGGMATVYLARQLSLDRQVAIKVMAPEASENPTHAARFEHEARTIARLEHPGIVGIHEVGRLADGRLFYVMPHLPNGDLAGRDLRADPLAIISVVRVLLQALGYAHAHGIVHRDVKPENVLFDAAGVPRLADFGIAMARRRATPRITNEGLALGSSGYMAPEQARGESIDGRADLYSVGVLTYQLLTGDLPFDADDELSLALMHAQDPPPRLPKPLQHWQGLIDRSMAKWPEQRYPDAAAMARALDAIERAERGAARWRAGSGPASPGSLRRRGVIAALVVVLATLTVAAWSLWPLSAPPAAPADQDAHAVAMATANAQLAAGALVVPAGANAAETLLGVLRAQPGRADAMNGLRRVFAGLAAQAAESVEAGDFDAVSERRHQAELLAEGLGALGVEGLQQLSEAIRRALEAEVAQAVAQADATRLQKGLARFAEFQLDASNAKALVARAMPESTSAAGPATGVAAGVVRSAPAKSVSVGEYRRFAEATRRAPSRCRARLSPLQLVDKRTWRDPGFAQTDASPVVCVSYADAEAYAAWLSQQTGARWRVPSAADEAALAGANVEVWTSSCAEGNQCARRLTQRAGSASSSKPQARDAARGFDEVGIGLRRD